MNGSQASAIVHVLVAAYPQSKKMREPETLKVYASYLAQLDHEIADEAVRDVIGESKWWPTLAEIKAAYDGRAAARRREAIEHEKQCEQIDEPSPAEHAQMLERMNAYRAERWGV